MKRSEMIKELVKSMGAHDSWELQCIYMLEVCEEAGMLPPTFKYWNSKNPEDVNERGIPKDLQVDVFNGDEMNYWEPE